MSEQELRVVPCPECGQSMGWDDSPIGPCDECAAPLAAAERAVVEASMNEWRAEQTPLATTAQEEDTQRWSLATQRELRRRACAALAALQEKEHE